MVGFVVLVGVGIVTVLRPELEDEPSEKGAAETAGVETSGESGNDEPVQE